MAVIEYEDAVEEGRRLVQRIERDGWRLGELADGVATSYGEETLKRYANDIGINFNTLRNYRSMHRKWPNKDKRPKSITIAKVLASSPNREDIVSRYPGLTEANALVIVAEIKRRKKAGDDKDLTVHALVAKACRILNAIIRENSDLDNLLSEIESYDEIEFEYVFKILDAMQKAKDRIDARMDRIKGQSVKVAQTGS